MAMAKKIVLVLLVIGIILLVQLPLFAYDGKISSGSGGATVTSGKLYGVGFSPRISTKGWNAVTDSSIRQLLNITKPYFTWARSFSCSGKMQNYPAIAKELGFKTAVAAWLDTDLVTNEVELNCTINAAKNGKADLIIIGGETLLRGDLTEQQLIDYIRRAKAAAPGVQVTTADSYAELMQHPAVLNEVDVVMANFYPYWEGIELNKSVDYLKGKYLLLKSMSGSKTVMIGETGWPSKGAKVGKAVPSVANEASYLKQLTNWTQSNNIPFFYFEAFDEPLKATESGLTAEGNFGIWASGKVLKAGMSDVLAPYKAA